MCKVLFPALCMYWEHEAEGESDTPKAGENTGPQNLPWWLSYNSLIELAPRTCASTVVKGLRDSQRRSHEKFSRIRELGEGCLPPSPPPFLLYIRLAPFFSWTQIVLNMLPCMECLGEGSVERTDAATKGPVGWKEGSPGSEGLACLRPSREVI